MVPVLGDRFLQERVGGRVGDRQAAMRGGQEGFGHGFEKPVGRKHPARCVMTAAGRPMASSAPTAS